jgi:hypothetical protein
MWIKTVRKSATGKISKTSFFTVFVWKEHARLQPALKNVATILVPHLFISLQKLDAVQATDSWQGVNKITKDTACVL